MRLRKRARIAIAVAIVAIVAIAAPAAADELAEQYSEAEALWKHAEAEKDPAKAAALWERAAEAYTAVARAAPEGHVLRKEAAYAAVLSWKNALAAAPAAPHAAPVTTSPSPRPIPAREQKQIDAFDLYLGVVSDPDDDERVMMQFLKARIYWRHDHLDEAVPLLEEIVADHLDHETAEVAVNLLLDSLNRARNYDEMLAHVDRLLAEKRFLADREELAERLERLKVRSLRKGAEELERQGRWSECGATYRAIYERNPRAEAADELLYNTGVCLETAREIGRAIAAFDELIERFPRSRLAQKATARTARLLAQIAEFARAASRLARYAKRYAGERDALPALSDAIYYYRGVGATAEAIAATRSMIARYARKRPTEAAAAAYLLADLYLRAGAPAKQVAQLERYLNDHGARGGIDRRILAHVALGEHAWRRSCARPDATGACVATSRPLRTRRARTCKLEPAERVTVARRNRARAASARRHFEKAVALYHHGRALDKVRGDHDIERTLRQRRMTRAYQAARFFLLERDFEAALAARADDAGAAETLVELASEYRAVAAVDGGDGEYIVAAHLRIGQLSRYRRDALVSARAPADTDTCERARELDEAAASAFRGCLALDVGVLARGASWTARCERELASLQPDDVPPLREHLGTPPATPVLSLEPPALRPEAIPPRPAP